MKTELRVANHTMFGENMVVEVLWMGELIATVTHADGPRVLIFSKYPISVMARTPKMKKPGVTFADIAITVPPASAPSGSLPFPLSSDPH